MWTWQPALLANWLRTGPSPGKWERVGAAPRQDISALLLRARPRVVCVCTTHFCERYSNLLQGQSRWQEEEPLVDAGLPREMLLYADDEFTSGRDQRDNLTLQVPSFNKDANVGE